MAATAVRHANVQVGQPVGVFRDYDYVRCGAESSSMTAAQRI